MAALKLKLPAFTKDDEVDLTVPSAMSLINSRNVEPIGYWFHLAAAVAQELSAGVYFGKKAEVVKEEVEASAQTFNRAASDGKYVKITKSELDIDWYDVLKLEQAEEATENDIRTAYRRRCLDTHPDKQPDHSDVQFKLVQRAFEILGEPTGRRIYDSSRPFDNMIPDEDLKMEEAAFFKVYGPVFERNAKWSIDTKIPKEMGDENTPMKDINRFYDAWYRFNSWRDFSHEGEMEEIREGMSREEKRYYQRENQRITDRLKRTEQKRIRTLVERAQKCDPRIRKIREKEVADREKEKADKLAEKERIRMEEVRRKQVIAEKEKADKLAAASSVVDVRKKIKEVEAQALDFFKSKGLLEDVETNLIQTFFVRAPNVTWLFSKIYELEEAEETLNAILPEPVEALSDKSVPAVTTFNFFVLTKEKQTGVTRYGEAVKKLPLDDVIALKKAEAEKRAARA